MKREQITLVVSLDVDERLDIQEIIDEVQRAIEELALPMDRESIDVYELQEEEM